MTPYPKRIIEVDLPIARISAHSRREKSIRHGHISTLHIWWARRPLAACRAVILASLWPDPEDLTSWLALAQNGGATGDMGPELQAPRNEELKPGEGVLIRPERFLGEARSQMRHWATRHMSKASPESFDRLVQIQKDASLLNDPAFLRTVLLDFIADFANWDNSTDPDFLATSRTLVQAAHEALGGEPGSRPMVIDPFAGGGSIPLEALRVGADAFASDLNPIPVLLNKVVLEYIPKYGQCLADEVRKWGQWVKEEAEKELGKFYPKDPDGSTPIAYLWARTILSEAPGQGAIPVEVPLMRSMWLCKKPNRRKALRWIRDGGDKVKTKTVEVPHQIDGRMTRVRVKRPLLEIFEPLGDSEVGDGTVARGNATCPVTGYTTKVASVRAQLSRRQGGAADSRLLAVVLTKSSESGRFYRSPHHRDLVAHDMAHAAVANKQSEHADDSLSFVPNEAISQNELRRISVPLYGITRWGDLFCPRQALALGTISQLIRDLPERSAASFSDADIASGLPAAVQTCLALCVDRASMYCNSMCFWHLTGEKVSPVFGRQALGMTWDFLETPILSESSGGLPGAINWVSTVCSELCRIQTRQGHIEQASATQHPLPDDSASAVITDPPYYDAVPYAHLSDFFYVWLKRMLSSAHPALFADPAAPKQSEIVVDRPHRLSQSTKGIEFYERELTHAFDEGRRVIRPDGLGCIVFASKTTSSWEAILSAVVEAGWVVTGSWPIDTEMEARVAAQGQARLGSSVHISVRPRERPDGSVITNDVGEWREVLTKLPNRIAEWMPRLADEGVVGADAIFACLGPALEIFSRYSRVEKASGEAVTLREYLEQVWAAVSNEALSMIFKDADAAGLEPDARLTAMWLWTIGGGKTTQNGEASTEGNADNAKATNLTGFTLEFDAARKIAQGLGIHLEESSHIVEVKGDKARMLPVAERVRHLFGKDATQEKAGRGRKKKQKQGSLFEEIEAIEAEVESGGNGRFGGLEGAAPGATVLDQVHQSMILFASGRGEALRRFLVDDGVGADARLWKLAQALSALYPVGTDEKRWVDGVLARKKGLGL